MRGHGVQRVPHHSAGGRRPERAHDVLHARRTASAFPRTASTRWPPRSARVARSSAPTSRRPRWRAGSTAAHHPDEAAGHRHAQRRPRRTCPPTACTSAGCWTTCSRPSSPARTTPGRRAVLARVDYERREGDHDRRGPDRRRARPTNAFVAPEARVLRNLPIALAHHGARRARRRASCSAVVSAYSYLRQARDLLRAAAARRDPRHWRCRPRPTASRRWTRSVEKIVQGTAMLVEDLEPEPDVGRVMLRRTVAQNAELYGSGIGYDPAIYGRRAPYVYQPSASTARRRVRDEGRHGSGRDGPRPRRPRLRGGGLVPAPVRRCAARRGPSRTTTRAAATCSPPRTRSPCTSATTSLPVSAVVSGDVSLTSGSHGCSQSLDLGRDRLRVPASARTGTFIAHPDNALHHERVDLQRGRGARRPAAARHRPGHDRRATPATCCSDGLDAA